MSALADDEADEYSADLFGNDEAAPALDYEPQPWHKPRKQFVRKTQWAAQITSLLESAARERFMYLTLPGSDLLDVRYLHDRIFAPNAVRLRFLGFDTSADPTNPEQAKFEGRLHSALGLQYLDQTSMVRPEDFRRVGERKSPAFREMSQQGPYDAVNVDLCGGILASTDVPSFLHALEAVLRVQSRRTTESLLFVTTRTDAQQVDSATYATLRADFVRAVKSNTDLSALIDSYFGSVDKIVVTDDTSEAQDIEFIAVFACWLAAVAAKVDLKVDLKSVQSYKVVNSSPCDDLASMAFLLTPVQTTPGPVAGEWTHSEASLANSSWKTIPSRLNARRKVDEILEGDADLEQQLRQATFDLLLASGYSVSIEDLP